MFKKLLSNLPFNPSLIGQVSFYTQRIRRETVTRQAGLTLMVLTMVVQVFAVLVPPASSLESSGNDIIPGGITSRENAVEWCNTNAEIRGIFAHFGVSCQAIAETEIVPSVNTRDYDSQMYSLGRYPYGKEGETTVPIGGQDFYMRYAWSWGDYDFEALRGTRSNGTPFLIMFDCGNIIIIGAPTPPPPPPPPPPAPEKCPLDNNILKSDSRCTPCPYNSGTTSSNTACKPPKCPYDNRITVDNANCTVCPYDSAITKNNPKCARCPYTGLTNISKIDTMCQEPCPYNNSIAKTDNRCERCPYTGLTGISKLDAACVEPCPYNPSISKASSSCKPCDNSKDQSDTSSCIELSKNAANTTQNIPKADGTIAKADDVIAYTLYAKNTGKVTVRNFAIQENIGDITDYADVVNLNGGSWDRRTNIVTWPAGDILAGATMQQHLTVKIKNPIPQTPISASNPGTGDMTLTNVYGNVVNIKLPTNVVKTTEQLTTQVLPKTGPGTSLMIGFSLTTVIAYFFARSKLFAAELDLVRREYSAVGGQ